MEKYIMIKSDDRTFIFTIMDCPEGDMICLNCKTEEELFKLIRNMDCEVRFTRPYLWVKQDKVNRLPGVEFFFVKESDHFCRVDFRYIRWIKAEGSYCRLYIQGEKEYLLSFNLTEIMAYLPSRDFIRVHRSYIVNISYVSTFFGNTLVIGKDWIPISKSHRKEVIVSLNLLGAME